MLVCHVSMRPRGVAVAAGVVEGGRATDLSGTDAVLSVLVDEPAAADETVSTYIGDNVVEAASAGDSVDASIPAVLTADVSETVAASDSPDASIAVTTSYANPGGTGNRTATITVTTTATLGGGTINMLVDGSQANGLWWTGAQSSRTMTFDFGAGASKVIDEFKWYQDVALAGNGHGTWVFGGSNDNSTYTEFPETFALGANVATATYPVTNTFGYRYYRLRQTFNQTSSTPFLREIEFKIG